jgi:pimeloyl-ACP methyl ester carboxylesterase
MNVDLVHVHTRDGLRLDGFLRKPAASTPSRFGTDVAICFHGVTGNFYQAGVFDEATDRLVEGGCAVLRVNNRGHDPISMPAYNSAGLEPLGAAYETVDDCRHDWDAWIGFAVEQGFQRIGLWGHSLGAVKSIYYMAQEHDPRVHCVVAASPPRFSYQLFSQAPEEGREFLRICQLAQQHVDAGEPETLLQTAHPVPLLVAARVFLDKYGPEARYDILRHIPNLRVPTLLFIGTNESPALSFAGSPPEMRRLAGEIENFRFESIPGADHFYTNQRDYVWDLVSGWLESPGRPD